MKIDRLLETVVLLLKYESVTARQLAERFDVSVRTIQRDMESLSVAGIPISSSTGAAGGYAILPSYKLANQFVNREDFRLLIMALKGLKSSYDHERIEPILNRYLALGQDNDRISVDYGVTQEGQDVQETLRALENAIHTNMEVEFAYQNVHGVETKRTVHPLQLKFKWYAWYLFAMDTDRNAIRTFKVARIRQVVANGKHFTPTREAYAMVAEEEAAYLRRCEWITLSCSEENLPLIKEYFADTVVEHKAGGDVLVRFHVPLDEPMWKALILGMGNRVRVEAPESYKDSLIRTAMDFLSNYDIGLS